MTKLSAEEFTRFQDKVTDYEVEEINNVEFDSLYIYRLYNDNGKIIQATYKMVEADEVETLEVIQ